MTNVRDILRECRPLKRLDNPLLETLEKNSTLIQAPKGSYLIRRSEEPDAAFVLVMGSAQVLVTRGDNTTIVAARLEAGSLIGEAAFLRPGGRRNSDVRLLTDATLLKINGDSLRSALHRSSELVTDLKAKDFQDSINRAAAASVLAKCISASTMVNIVSSRRHYSKGDIIFREGDVAEELFLIISGSVEIFRQDNEKEILFGHIGQGSIFGERGVIQQLPRTATVVATEDTEVLILDGSRFRGEAAKSPALQNLISSQEAMYHLPGRGLLFQGYGELDGMSTVTSTYKLEDGRQISAVRLLEADRIGFRDHAATGELSWIETSAFSDVRVSLFNNNIVAIESSTSWAGLEDAVAFLLDAKPIDPWRQALFQKVGVFIPPARINNRLPSDLICTCACVQYETIMDLLATGAELKDIQNQTGAGTICGSCHPRLEDLSGIDTMMPVRIIDCKDLAHDIRQFRLVGFDTELPRAQPGQHIVLEGLIDNDWVQRSYTLVGVEGGLFGWEIAVKREPHGLFSNWLFVEGQGAILRVSEPQGKETPTDKNIICLVAGIGVTPAVAIARIARERNVHVCYSFRSCNDAAYLEELMTLENEGRIQLTLHETKKVGRIAPVEIQKYLSNANYLICGPKDFERDISDYLKIAGVKTESIIVESFHPAGETSPHSNIEPRPVLPSLCPAHEHIETPSVNAPLLPSQEAEVLIRQFHSEMNIPVGLEERLSSIKHDQLFNPEVEELEFAARVAWRNANRCIGRLYWPGLFVRDRRNVNSPAEMLQEMAEHTRIATNGGRLRSMMTIFAPLEESPPKILSPQLVRYAGYQRSDGSINGDPAHIELTQLAIKNGWTGEGGRFDILPLIVKDKEGSIHMHRLDPADVMEVKLEHPHYEWFAELGLKWHALPAVTELCLDAYGRMYPVVFNGVYMGTEIGARNLCDPYRFNLLPEVANRLGLDTRSESSLWRDRALVEVNIAVIHSYRRAGVTILDHHAASADFMKFVDKEHSCGRQVHAEWSWIVPPISGSSVPQFHLNFPNQYLKPALVSRPQE